MTTVHPNVRPIVFLVVRTTTLLAIAVALILGLLPAVLVAARSTLAVSGS